MPEKLSFRANIIVVKAQLADGIITRAAGRYYKLHVSP
jgi:hypothetical protein